MNEFEKIKGLEIRNWLPSEREEAIERGVDRDVVEDILQQSAQRAIRGDRIALQDGQMFLGEVAVDNS